MLSEIFYWILNMSITGTIMGGVVLLLDKIKKLPRRLCYVLWAIPLIRLWIPVAPVSEYGLMEFITRLSTRTVVITDSTHTMAVTNHMAYAESYFPMTYKTDMLEKIFHIASVIWTIVAVCIVIVLIISYISGKREVKNAEYYRDNVWFSDEIQFPMVYGIIRPRIMLPSDYKERDITFVLTHENVHIKRLDNLWRVIALVTCAVHWFNPFIWLFLRCFFNEMELSCDEKVLARCDDNKRKAYAMSLVESAEMKLAFSSGYSGGKLHKRIEHILIWKRMSAFAAVCFIVFAIAIAYVLITNPM